MSKIPYSDDGRESRTPDFAVKGRRLGHLTIPPNK